MENKTVIIEDNNNKDNVEENTRVYRRRWFMLFLYFISVIVSNLQWAQYSSIANVVAEYYNVSYEAVNWTSMVFLLIYVILMFPASYVLQVLGLRDSILAALTLTCLSCWLKLVAVSPNKFWLVLVSQSIAATSTPIILSALTLLTAEWFSLKQISTASSIGVLAYQLGSGTGFILPTFAVTEHFDSNAFEHNFSMLSLGIAIFTTGFLIIFFVFFEAKPRLPPSQAKLNNAEKTTELLKFFKLVLNLLKNPSFLIVLISCGVINGISTAIDTLLNQMMTPYYENSSYEAGRIVFVTYGSAAIGPLVAGLILDKFKRYKLTCIVSLFFFLGLMISFTFIFDKGIVGLYINLSMLGLFAAAIELIGLETAMEITYPVPESICAGCIFGVFQTCSIGFIYFYSWIFYDFGEFNANIFLIVCAAASFLLTMVLKIQNNRQNARCVVV